MVLALLLFAEVAGATAVTASGWLGPSYVSPDAGTASQNAVQALYQGVNAYGTPDTPGYYAGPVSSLNASQMVGSPNFFSWNGQPNPSGPYENQFGNAAAFAAAVDGQGVKISLSQMAFTATSSDPTNYLGFDYAFTGYGTDQYGTTVLGVVHGPNGDTLVTSGGSNQQVDALYIAGVFNSLWATCNACTEDEDLQAILAAESALPQGVTDYTGSFIWNPGGGGIPNNNVRDYAPDVVTGIADLRISNGNIPEPGTLVLTLLPLGFLMLSRSATVRSY